MDTLTQDNRNWFQKLMDNIRNSTTANQQNFAATQVTNTPPNYSAMPIVQPVEAAKARSEAKFPGVSSIVDPAVTPTPTPRPSGGATPSAPTSTPDAGVSLQDLSTTQINAAREEARRQAGAGFERARGIYDEGMGLLKNRRQEFQNLFEQGRGNILDRFEQGRGELQASDQGAQTRLANALRAMGMGGSAYIKSTGKQTQDAAKALGGLQTERNNNENANLGEFNSRQDWANTQEGALQRSLEDANNARSAVESSSDIGYLQDIGNLFNTILSNQLAAKAAAGSYTANPYAVNISDMTKALNGTLPNMTGGEGTVQDVNLKEQDPTLALLKKARSGVAGAGLYRTNGIA